MRFKDIAIDQMNERKPMTKQEYKELAIHLDSLKSELSEMSELKNACEMLVEHCRYKSRPSVINLIKAIRNEIPGLGLKEAKDIVEELIQKHF
jgi:ribosomal protein L7/L12